MKLRLFVLLFFGALSAFAETDKNTLDAAEAAYKTGDFKTALSIYQKASLNDRPSALYNLATIEFKNADIGRAYGHLLLAHRLDPWDADIRHNLDFVRAELNPSAASVQAGKKAILGDDFALPKALYFSIALLCLSLYLFLLLRNTSLAIPAHAFFIGLIFTASIVSMLAWVDEKRNVAVIVEDALSIKSGPSSTFSELAKLSTGSLVTIDEEKADWAKISFRINSGPEQVGWVPLTAVLYASK
jgi:tetratricopeptide (TPR) repeat protein